VVLQDTHDWWALLRAVATLNLLAWLAVALWCWRARDRWPPEDWLDRRWQLLLCAGYVFGCAWRSLLPVYDVPRLVMVDSFWSSVIVGRSVATIAELCFAAQWALLLRRVSRTAGSATGLAVSQAGLVAFVGLVAPHLVRRSVVVTHGRLLALAALSGGVLLLAADVAARSLLVPQELPVGMLTAVFGGLYLLRLLRRRGRA